jgi:hypothetical protein
MKGSAESQRPSKRSHSATTSDHQDCEAIGAAVSRILKIILKQERLRLSFEIFFSELTPRT